MTSLTRILQTPAHSVSGRQLVFLGLLSHILVNIVVLNLFVEYVDGVVIDSFTISLLTAVLLKVMLVLLSRLEEPVSEYFRSKGTAAAKAVGVVAVLAILFFGKLLILEAVNFVFGDDVELGHFLEVVLLILAMMVARFVMDWLFDRLGTGEVSAADMLGVGRDREAD